MKYVPSSASLTVYPQSDLLTERNTYARWQFLYQSGEIGASGKISHISLQYGAAMASAVSCPNVTIKMGHNNLSTLTSTFASNVRTGKGNMTTVLSNATLTFAAGAKDSVHDIALSTPFDYNGVDNIMVEFERTSACSGIVYDTFTTVGYDGTAASFSPGSSTAILVNGAANVRLVFAGGDNLVHYYSGTMQDIQPPFAPTGYTNRSQMLHPASRINGSGPITGIAMVVGATTTAQTYTVTIRLGHSTLTGLTNVFANNYSDTPVTVADKLLFSVPAGAPTGSILWLPFNGTFNYNGKDNLIVDIDVSESSGGQVFWNNGFDSSSAIQAIGRSGSATAETLALKTYNTFFRFNGGQITVLPRATPNTSGQVLGSGTSAQLQSLYHNSLLGTSGTIQNIYVRLAPTSRPAFTVLTNYKVYMGHTTKTTYSPSDTFASNMDENALVMSGTVAVADDTPGEWVKIWLDKPFTYDSTKNLSILFTTDSGPSGNEVSVSEDPVLFPANIGGRHDNDGTSSRPPAWHSNGIVDLKFDLVK